MCRTLAGNNLEGDTCRGSVHEIIVHTLIATFKRILTRLEMHYIM